MNEATNGARFYVLRQSNRKSFPPHPLISHFPLISMPPARTLKDERRRITALKEVAKKAARSEALAQLQLPEAQRKSIRSIAISHGVDPKTLGRLVRGQPTMGESNEEKQHLTPAEESALVDFLVGMGRRGLPLTHRMIYEHANAMFTKKMGNGVEIGGGWFSGFMTRHDKRIKTYRPTPLERSRANGMNKQALDDYQDTVEELLTQFKPPERNIFGTDEVGMNLGVGACPEVVGEVGQTNQHLQEDGDRENVTVIETICADGTTLLPTVIFKGKYFLTKWGANNPDNAK